MKNTNYGIVAITLLTASAGASYAQDLTLDFGPLVGSQIVFNGGVAPSFNFTPGTVGPNNLQGYQWNVTSESGSAATGSALGDPGAILNGPFVYGSVSTAGLYQSAQVIGPTVMDEPTAALGVPEQRKVMSLIQTLKTNGVGIIFISHNLGDIFAVADRIVVLRGVFWRANVRWPPPTPMRWSGSWSAADRADAPHETVAENRPKMM